MPFIVSLYKYLIFGFCFIILVAIVLGLMFVLNSGNAGMDEVTPYAIATAIAALMMLVLSLGAIAILISLHDRHREIAEGIDRVAAALEHWQDRSGPQA
ncbi:uncharacterized membrane protein YhaH (DUF805 family) [Sphingobium sp. B1D7B]|uniref:hypothetical protein n=1 Tax=unclassified Sphingobium TaxID=2611147 RepID=UPI00222503B7|nr:MULTISPECIES: hypothetical protein [unclassified Sphingobium]MCW2391915.1 uncharacterized membrane protein YhaH (DUF805 family) [Sphingobium sp. B11D3A]MCW2403671.1 uncharacterized membrane protein YhaH (DUF805 family) [Sphingobium sp. B1D7B]